MTSPEPPFISADYIALLMDDPHAAQKYAQERAEATKRMWQDFCKLWNGKADGEVVGGQK